MAARTVALKVRFEDFSTITRSHTEPNPIDTTHDLYAISLRLLDRADVGDRLVRLLGVGGESLTPSGEPRQLDLGGTDWSDLEEAVDEVRLRFGDGAVGPARLSRLPGDTGSGQVDMPDDGNHTP